jgi:hypothetical protein
MQASVLRFVDHAHTAAANFVDDLIVGNDPVDHERGVHFRVDPSYGGESP